MSQAMLRRSEAVQGHLNPDLTGENTFSHLAPIVISARSGDLDPGNCISWILIADGGQSARLMLGLSWIGLVCFVAAGLGMQWNYR